MSASVPKANPMSQTVRAKTPRKNGAFINAEKTSGAWVRYRGYVLRCGRDAIAVEHALWRAFPDMPKSFRWYNSDRADCERYLERLYTKDVSYTSAIERDGRVADLEFPSQSDMHATEWYGVNAKTLLDAIALRSQFDVPIWGRVRFLTDRNYLVPTEYIGALIKADPKMFGHLDPAADWHLATEADLQRMGIRPEQVTSGMYRPRTAAAAALVPTGDLGDDLQPETPGDAPPAPVEATLRRWDRGSHIEWITRVVSGDTTWYARRLYRETNVFYEATAWQPNGPWTVWRRDSSLMLALGIVA